ncbi:cytochrome protein [Nemania sp. FL0916]|nr:cytochrome protein [Nemania sp. FL0916]
MAHGVVLVGGVVAATVLIIGAKLFSIILRKRPGPLPPGPKGLPLVGNIRDLPADGDREWEHWLKHKDVYGPISSVTALGSTIVIIHSAELALRLLDKKTSIYSSRPSPPFAELTGWSGVVGLLSDPYEHRVRRGLVHPYLGTPKAIKPYLPLQEKETHRLLFRILQDPEPFEDHTRITAASIILNMVYGYTVEPHKTDPLVTLADEALAQFSAATVPGAWLVDLIPSMMYIPDWLPGAGWKRTGKKWRACLMETIEKPLRFAQQQISKGHSKESFVSGYYDKKGETISPQDIDTLKWIAVSIYTAAADTTVNTITAFFLAMTLFPEVQRKAREEIDRVIGTGRLPMYSDRPSLPYIDAVISEAWRWHAVTPMALPHKTSVDDFVDGYFIPKGSVVMANVWWFMHDPETYPDPSTFNPSRFLGPNPEPDPLNHIFGYGRRICPGRYLANTSVWLMIARSLAVFDISKGLDENGREIEPTVQFMPGIISRAAPFKATIKPRSPQHEALIRQVEEIYPWEKGDSDKLSEIVI